MKTTKARCKDTDAWLESKPDVDTVALIYNCRTWIRWGGGDKTGAVAENEKLREAVAAADEKVKRGAMLHYWWDRAYLEAEAGRAAAADRSRAEFDALGNTPDDADSRKVLEAWLLYKRGDGAGAKAAASAVNVEKDGDLQDLYVVALGARGGRRQRRRREGARAHSQGAELSDEAAHLREMVRDATRASPSSLTSKSRRACGVDGARRSEPGRPRSAGGEDARQEVVAWRGSTARSPPMPSSASSWPSRPGSSGSGLAA